MIKFLLGLMTTFSTFRSIVNASPVPVSATDVCERAVRDYMNDLFMSKKQIHCAPPSSNCFDHFELESMTAEGDQTYFASYVRDEGYTTADIFRVTVNQSCDVIKVSDDSN